MFDLQKMTLRDMSECGLAIRHLSDKANSMEDVSRIIIEYLYNDIIDIKNGEKTCVLVRFFKTHSYGELPLDLQEDARLRLGNITVPDSLKCLTLLASAGEVAEWNSRHKSVEHKAIPLKSEEAIARIPMISQLIQQLGLNPGTVVQPDPNLITDLEQRMYNVFYVPDALGSPYIPSQSSFVIPFKVKSVVGFGGLLPSGNMFAVLMFLKVAISRTTVDLLRPLALNVKMAILPFDSGRIFSTDSQYVANENTKITPQDETIARLNSQIATLTQLLDVSEQSTKTQSDRLEKAITHLQKTLDKLQKTQIQLIHTEKMSSLGQLVAGIAHEINNPINFIHGNVYHALGYTQDLLKLVRLYQQYYPNPPQEIQEVIDSIELDFLSQDLNKIFNSMTIGTERIKEIVQSLRTFSRVEHAVEKKVDIHTAIDSTLMILEHRLQATDKYPKIKVIKEYGQLPLLDCYFGQLNQVFMNIIANAIDALQEGIANKNNQFAIPTIHIRTQVLNDKWVIISIADNGPGINGEVCSKLFDPFFTTKPVGKGTGIGLSISHQIVVEKHGGELSCHSIPGQGAEFLIKIPLRRTQNAEHSWVSP
ncbi:sensor histidine kinase [Scytonema sp. PCC 10023]|uniref:sensor histidine kinase n=1 Tax=Scytonema sp. PCC 10023 TaxID=1680591 RepID=UPI0039C7132F